MLCHAMRLIPWLAYLNKLSAVIMYMGGLLVAQMIKNLPMIQETWVQFLGREYPGEGNGNPLQYSCLDNPHGQRSLAALQSVDSHD